MSSQFCVQMSTLNSSVLVCCTARLAGVWWGTISLHTPVAFMPSLGAFAALPNFPMPKLGHFFFPSSSSIYRTSLLSSDAILLKCVRTGCLWDGLSLYHIVLNQPRNPTVIEEKEILHAMVWNKIQPQPPSLFFLNSRWELRKPHFKLLFLIRLKRCRVLLTSWSIMDIMDSEGRGYFSTFLLIRCLQVLQICWSKHL